MPIIPKYKYLFLIGSTIIIIVINLIVPIRGFHFKEIIINLLSIGVLSLFWIFIIKYFINSER
jgi:hypothetical protein